MKKLFRPEGAAHYCTLFAIDLPVVLDIKMIRLLFQVTFLLLSYGGQLSDSTTGQDPASDNEDLLFDVFAQDVVTYRGARDDGSSSSPSDEFWKYFDGQRTVDYGPDGHPFERKKQQRQRERQQRRDQQSQNLTSNDSTISLSNQILTSNGSTVSDSLYKPLRITYATGPIEKVRGQSTIIDNTIDYVLSTVLPEATRVWSGHLSVYPVDVPIDISSDDCGGRFLNTGLQAQSFNNSDLVIIVDGDIESVECQSSVEASLAFASVCTLDQYGRPVVGFMTFCLSAITASSQATSSGDTSSSSSSATSTQIQQQQTTTFLQILQQSYGTFTNKTFRASHVSLSLLSVVIHELAHALGVIAPLFIFFRDIDTGIPYTTIDANGTIPDIEKTCANGTATFGAYPDDNIIQTIQQSDGRWFQYLVTPRVQQVARNHFNCSDIPGARLEDNRECIGSHWHERDLYTELLSPLVSSIGENVLSPFTLALLEDSGWYQVDYTGSKIPSFGVSGGCDFLLEKCIVNEQVPSYVVSEFCNVPLQINIAQGFVAQDTLVNNLFCEPSHKSWALCDLFQFKNNSITDPSVELYFSNPNLHPEVTTADSCPIPSVPLGLDCTKTDSYSVFYPGEKVGPTSRCLNAFYNETLTGIPIRQPACAEIVCDTTSNSVVIQLGSDSLICEYSKQVLVIPGTNNGYIECPRREAMCPDLFTCPYACSGRGTCTYKNANERPVCVCNDPSNTDPACASPAVIAARGGTPTTATPVAVPIASPTNPPIVVPTPTYPQSSPTVTITTTAPVQQSMPTYLTSSPISDTVSTSSPISTITTTTPVSFPVISPTISSGWRHLEQSSIFAFTVSITVIVLCHVI